MTYSPPRPPRQRLIDLGRRPTRLRAPRPNKRIVDVAAVAAGLGLGASMILPISQVAMKSVTAAGGMAILLGDVTAMAGTYLLLLMVLLAARLPGIERAVGQDRLIRWHRRLSPAPLALLGAHGLFTTLGYAQAAHKGFWAEGGSLISTMTWIFAAVVAYAMLIGIAGVSIRAVRRKMSYDTWWVIHLYTYLALAFSVPHQIISGTNFVGHHLAQTLWLLLWFSTAGTVVIYRLGLPLARTVFHRLRVAEVRPEGPGVFSVVVGGRHLERLAVDGGQYFAWRFLVRGMWWHAHPLSLSAAPKPPYMRVTIKMAGDATSQIARLRPGTRIAIEGPYGAFTDSVRTRRKVALVGAGVGVTPLRAMLDDIPAGVDVVMVQRASRPDEMIHRTELAALVNAREGRMVELVGSRRQHRLDDPAYLHRIIPDVATRDLYVCGPDQFSAGVAAAAERLGLSRQCIHIESFEL